MKTAWLVACVWLAASGAQPAADALYPGTTGVPLNSKLLLHHTPYEYGVVPTVTVKQGGVVVYGAAQTMGEWVVYEAAGGWKASTQYDVTVECTGRAAYVTSFRTGMANDTVAPVVEQVLPAAGEAQWPATRPPEARYSKPLNPMRLVSYGYRLTMLPGSYYQDYLVKLGADGRTLTSDGTMTFGWKYELKWLDKGFEDLCGNRIAPAETVRFATYPALPGEGPKAVGTVPAEGETGVATNVRIYVRFDQPMEKPESAQVELGSSADPAVGVQVTMVDDGKGMVVSPAGLLRSRQAYTLKMTGLKDLFGLEAGVVSLKFETGLLPESVQARVETAEALRVPRGTAVARWKFTRKVNPYRMPRFVDVVTGQRAGAARLLEDGVTMELNLAGPGSYRTVERAYDQVQELEVYVSSQIGVVVSGEADTEAPALEWSLPAQGQEMPAGQAMVLAFQEEVKAPLEGEARLTGDGQTLAWTATVSGTQWTIRAAEGWKEGVKYRFEWDGPQDGSGNRGEAVGLDFAVAQAPARLELVESRPAAFAVGVDPGSVIELTFNQAVKEQSVAGAPNVTLGDGTKVPGRWRVEGKRIVFEPTRGFPAGSQVNWGVAPQGLGNASLTAAAGGRFWTSGSPEAAPKRRVVEQTPAAGGVVYPGPNCMRFVFDGVVSENEVQVEVGPLGLSIWQVSWAVGRDGRSLNVSMNIPYNLGKVPVRVTRAAGNRVGAEVETYETVLTFAPVSGGISTVAESEIWYMNGSQPAAGAGLEAGEAVVLYLKGAPEREKVEAGLKMYAGTKVVEGSMEWSPGGEAVVFRPATKWPAGEQVVGLLSQAAWGRTRVEEVKFGMAQAEPLVRWSVQAGGELPAGGVVEFEASRDVAAGAVHGAVMKSVWSPEIPVVELVAKQVTPRRIRLERKQEPGQGLWAVNLTVDGLGELATTFYGKGPEVPDSHELMTGPTEAMGDVPVNAVVWVRPRTYLNMATARPKLKLDGVEVGYRVDWKGWPGVVLLRPYGLLRAESQYEVELDGLEDALGRPYPAQRWSFRTGRAVDREDAMMTNVPLPSQVVKDGPQELEFDRPVFPVGLMTSPWLEGVMDDFVMGDPGSIRHGHVAASEDGRKLTYQSVGGWTVGSTLTAMAGNGAQMSWTGGGVSRAGNTPWWQGSLVVEATGRAPAVVAVNPAVDGLDEPLDAKVQVRFDMPVQKGRLSGVWMKCGTRGVEFEPVLSEGEQVLTLVTKGVLPAMALCTVGLNGVAGPDGTSAVEGYQWSFQTGASGWREERSARWNLVSTSPLVAQVDFQTPLNAVALGAAQAYVTVREKASVAAELKLERGGRRLTVTTKWEVGGSEQYALSVSGLVDARGRAVTLDGLTGSVMATPEKTAQVQMVYPAEGEGLRQSEVAAVVWDRDVTVGGVRLWREGEEEPVTTTATGASGSLSLWPTRGWYPGAAYRARMEGVMDRTGRKVESVEWSFRVLAEPQPSPTPKLVSTSPKNGEVGVAVDAPVVFEFSEAVLPRPDMSHLSAVVGTSYGWEGAFRIEWLGRRVVVTAQRGVPAGEQMYLTLSVLGVSLYPLGASVRYTTAARPDTVAPVLEGATPASGSRLLGGRNTILLRFSEPVRLSGSCCRLVGGGQSAEVWSSWPVGGDGRTLLLSAYISDGGTNVISLLPGIMDLAGNALAPAALSYEGASADESGSLMVVGSTPKAWASNVALDAAVELKFNQEVEEEALASALRVRNGVSDVAFTVEQTDGKTLVVRPAAAWQAGTTVKLEVSRTLASRKGVLLNGDFSMEFYTKSATAELAEVEVRERAVELRYSAALEHLPAEPFGLREGSRRIEARVEQAGAAWVRIVPDEALEEGRAYVLMAGPGREIPVRMERPGEKGQEATGLELELPEGMHRFGLAEGRWKVVNGQGREVSYELVTGADGVVRVVVAEREEGVRVYWEGREVKTGTRRR